MWARSFNEGTNQTALGIVAGRMGTTVVFGQYEGSLVSTSPVGDAAGDGFALALDACGEVEWAIYANGTGPTSIDHAVVDDGRLYIAGHYRGMTTVDQIPLLWDPTDGTNAFVAEVDTTLAVVRWVRWIGGTGEQNVYGIAADGNVAIAGAFDTQLVLDGPPVLSVGGVDGFLGWLDPDNSGVALASETFGGSADDWGAAVTMADGRTYVGLTFYSIDLPDPSSASSGFSAVGGTDVAVVGYDGDRSPMWSLHPDGNNYEIITDMTVDGIGDVLVGGTFGGVGNGSINLSQAHAKSGLADAFVASIKGGTAGGNVLWSRSYGGDEASGILTLFEPTPAIDAIQALHVASDGTIYATGICAEVFSGATCTDRDVFVLAIESLAATTLWESYGAGPGLDVPWGMTEDSDGHILVVGEHDAYVGFGTTQIQPNNAIKAAFVAKLAP